MRKVLEKMKRDLGEKIMIEIPVGKGRPIKFVQSSKLSNELGIITRKFSCATNKWKELNVEEKDDALISIY